MPFDIKLHQFIAANEQGEIDIHPHIKNVVQAKGVPIKVAYDISKIAKKLKEEVVVYVERRTELIKSLGAEETTPVEEDGKTVQKPTGSWRVKPENFEEFMKQQAELLDKSVTIEVNPIKLSQLGDKVEGITPEDLVSCHAFIIE